MLAAFPYAQFIFSWQQSDEAAALGAVVFNTILPPRQSGERAGTGSDQPWIGASCAASQQAAKKGCPCKRCPQSSRCSQSCPQEVSRPALATCTRTQGWRCDAQGS
eukprot:TRINITY_DN6882_c0_g1_i1.p3 TRINITY_DN6882_c0_g1~~TRINITY_DN6882_c0_g1_i1.p3  ORF type:complete len:106 (-),score=8.26 TRINITY_DN6882_c0_g1_i1:382-699(-)